MTATDAAPLSTDDLRALLSHEHERLHALFEDVVAAFDSGAREAANELFGVLEKSLEAHFRLEEEYVLPALAMVEPREAASLRAEHDSIRAKLTELGVGVDLHTTHATAIHELVRVLDAHAAREDAIAYRCAETSLSDPTRARLRTQTADRMAMVARLVARLRPATRREGRHA